ncbi:hypothetical protein VTK56DRAFT_5425 [Thermocarpiscus australiensis]
MDDPWGSPWAATDSDKDQKLTLPPKSELVPPPRAFLSASSSPRIPAVLEQSPWGVDDDGFGEWTAASDAPSIQSGWGGGLGTSSPNLDTPPRDDVFDRTSPIAWPETVATPKLVNGFAFRQPPPDPWASECPSRRVSNDGTSTPRVVVDDARPVEAPIDALAEVGVGLGADSVWDRPDVEGTRKQEEPPGKLEHVSSGSEDACKAEKTEPTEASDSHGRMSIESAARSHEYQSSTPSNGNTDHDDERCDSPVTSADEETKTQGRLSRKESGKVQELVVKFDGLARAASQESLSSRRGGSRSPLRVEGKDGLEDVAEFGDFEEANQDGPPLPLETPAISPSEDKAAAPTLSAPSSPQSSDRPSIPDSQIARFKPPDFDIDSGLVEKLFESSPSVPTKHDRKVNHEVPDHIIRDSFTEISERKTWYRISRLGSSRRHNAGDEESYRRVAWPSSTVHEETIKIVRRWMEEDSIAGRVTLGGGISKTQKNMFGWDSSTEPVALAAVFGKKTSHSRASSLQITGFSSQGIEGPSKKALRSTAHRPSGSAGPIVASFGWSSGLPSSEAQTRILNGRPEPVGLPARDSKERLATPQVSGAPFAPPRQTVTTSSPVSRIPAYPESGKPDEDDDEWGEMVSSPAESKLVQHGSAAQLSVDFPSSITSAPEIVAAAEIKNLDALPTNYPWKSADFSVFESAPAKPALHSNGPSAIHIPQTHSALEPTPAHRSKMAAVSSASVTAVSGPLELPARDPASTPTPPRVGPLEPCVDAKSRVNTPQNDHGEAAERIIANLPDLSYMLR